MLGYTAAYTDAPAERGIDLSKRTARRWDTLSVPTTGDVILLPQSTEGWCRTDVPGRDGMRSSAGLTYTCSLPRGHADTIPHTACMVAVGLLRSRYHAAPDGYDLFEIIGYTQPEPTAENVTALAAEVARLRADLAEQTSRADTAEQKISDIRDYVIERKQDGEICAAGTLRFLRHFNLPAWEQTYTVRYGDLTFDVEAMSYRQAAGRAERAMRRALESGDFPFALGYSTDYSPSSIDDENGESDSYPYDGEDDGE